jgi:hypothetical protein
MNVGVSARQGVAAVLARAARSGLWSGTEEPLSQPEGESLFADAGGSVEKERTRKRIATNRIVETGAEGGVAVEGEKGHGRNLTADAVGR